MTLGEFIQSYRAEHGLSQRQFAHNCDLSHSYISMIERGINPRSDKPIVPTIGQLKKIADGMGMSMMSLFEIVDDMPVDVSEPNASARAFEDGRVSSLDSEIASLILGLTPEKKKQAVRFLRYLVESEED